jgi:hypothetical protein
VLTAEDALIGDLGDAVQRDLEVRQARMIADAARSRLLACVTGPQDVIDLAEAQRMLDAFRNAHAHAEDAEDRVLLYRGLLTPAEADQRAARRRPASCRPDGPGTRETGTGKIVTVKNVVCVIAGAVAPVAVGLAGAALARRLGVRLPRARR